MARPGGLGMMGADSLEEEYDPADYEDDATLGLGDDDDDMGPTAGPFESYADTVFNPEATPEERASALREAILTVVEERGME